MFSFDRIPLTIGYILIVCCCPYLLLGSPVCPNACSGHGECRTGSTGYCYCYSGFIGIDCSQRLCPAGRAWFDFPSADNIAHSSHTECSNMGICNRQTGDCICRDGYTGSACDKMKCGYTDYPTCMEKTSSRLCGDRAICSGNGRCMSLRSSSLYYRSLGVKVTYPSSSTSIGETSSLMEEYSDWDADMIHGCVCDRGWEGVNCDRKSCPKGDDPLTKNINNQLIEDEIQFIDCSCVYCTIGTFAITIQGKTTPYMPLTTSQEIIRFHIKQLEILELFNFTILNSNTFCNINGTVSQFIFLLPQGPQPSIQIITKNIKKSTHIYVHTGDGDNSDDFNNSPHSLYIPSLVAMKGTREHIECSNHGSCNYNTGICECSKYFKSSDGFGNNGYRMDCGYSLYSQVSRNYSQYIPANMTLNTSNYNITIQTKCPFINNKICAGHGECDSNIGICICYTGFIGDDCNKKQCGLSLAWFGNNLAKNHTTLAICGGVGNCNYNTGVCENCGGIYNLFSGDSCEYLSCYSDKKGVLCSGNGQCLTMSNAVHYHYNSYKVLSNYIYNSTWDAHVIKGCVCTRAPSIDNQYQDRDQGYFDIYDSPDLNVPISFFTNNSDQYVNVQMNSVGNVQEGNTKFYRGPYSYTATDYTGYHCRNALCPTGDNPNTLSDVDEIQKFHCRSNRGNFQLKFRENITLSIPYNASRSFLKHRLQQLYTIHHIEIMMMMNNTIIDSSMSSNHTICTDQGDIDVYITFLSEHGNLPLLSVYSVDDKFNEIRSSDNSSNYITIEKYVKGTKEDLECSAMGNCDESRGVCQCREGYRSSNGTVGFPGQRGDCSYYDPFYTTDT